MRRVAALLLVVPIVAGCGAATSQSGTASPELLASSAEKATEAGSSRMSWDMRVEAAGESGKMTGEGAFDYRRNVGRIAFDLSPLEPDLEKVEIIIDGTVFFVRGLGEDLPPGKSWVKIDTAKLPRGSRGALGQISSPTEELKFLRAVSKDVEEVGEDEVRGEPTTRYRAVIDVRKLAEVAASEAPPKLREEMRREATELFEEAGVDEAPMDVWLDRDGLPRKVTIDLVVEAEGEKAKVQTSVEFFDFGAPVHVTHPPASETVEMDTFGEGWQ